MICTRRSGRPSTTPWTCFVLGAEVREISIPLVALAGAIFVGVADTEGAGARDEILRHRAAELDPASRTRLQAAALVPAKVYNRAMKARVLLRQQCLQALQQVDILVSATMPHPPPKHSALTAPFRGAEDVLTVFLPARLYGLLLLRGVAGDFHPWRLHQRSFADRLATWSSSLCRSDAAASGPGLRAGDAVAHAAGAGARGIASRWMAQDRRSRPVRRHPCKTTREKLADFTPRIASRICTRVCCVGLTRRDYSWCR